MDAAGGKPSEKSRAVTLSIRSLWGIDATAATPIDNFPKVKSNYTKLSCPFLCADGHRKGEMGRGVIARSFLGLVNNNNSTKLDYFRDKK